MQIGTHGFRRLDLDRAGCEDTVEQRAAHEESDPEEEPSHSGSSVEDCSDGHEPRRQVVDGVEEGIHSLSEEGQEVTTMTRKTARMMTPRKLSNLNTL